MKVKLKGTSAGMLLLLCVFGFTACEHNSPAPTQPPVALQPMLSSIQTNIFTRKCVNAGCHPGGGAPMSLQANASFNNLVNVNSTTSNPSGVLVVPNNDAASILFLRVSGATRGRQMPLGLTPLSADEVNAIQTWINTGALNN